MNRRLFVQRSLLAGMGVGLTGTLACSTSTTNSTNQVTEPSQPFEPFFKLSLAQWSIHRMIQNEGFDPYLFASKAKELGFEGLEYVSQMYFSVEDSLGGEGFNTRMDSLVSNLKQEANSNGMKSLIMMTDLGENADMAVSDNDKRTRAIEYHYPWADATAALGCHSMRINMFGEFEEAAWKTAAIDALGRLGEYAAAKNINVIIENHGWLTSNATLLMEVINEVGMDNVGTLPDFGNFCTKRADQARWGECLEEYDRYKGVQEMMPAATAVSAKSHDFDENGNEVNTDYKRMLQIVKDAGYSGYIGVEYEGNNLGEEEGILATKNLLLKAAQELETA